MECRLILAHSLSFVFEVKVNVVPTWTTVPLLPAVMTLLSSKLGIDSDNYDGDGGSGAAYLVVTNGHHCLLASSAGTYRITMETHCPFEGKQRSQLLVEMPTCARTDLTFVVADRENVQVTAEPSLGSTTISSKHTTFRAFVPPTPRLAIRWTEPLAILPELKTEARREPARLSITVDQQHLFSVGEGMLLSSSRFKYDIRYVTLLYMDMRKRAFVWLAFFLFLLLQPSCLASLAVGSQDDFLQ